MSWASDEIAHVLEPDDDLLRLELARDGDRALGDVLREVTDPLHVAGHADGRDRLAQVDGQGLAPRDRQDRPLLDLPLERIEAGIGGDHRLGELHVAPDEARHRVHDHLFGDPAHLRDPAPQVLKIGIVRADDMFGHDALPP